MNRFQELLTTDFDGQSGVSVDDVIYDGLDDPRHRGRVPGLSELMNDSAASEQHRYLACLALTTWGESEGYQAVIAAAGAPKEVPWYEASIDRMFSVDDTFAHLLTAVDESDEISVSKGTTEERAKAIGAFVGIADSEYFDGKLGYSLTARDGMALLAEIESTVERGVAALDRGEGPKFDLAAQLIDLASVVAPADEHVSVAMARKVLDVASHPRALIHAVPIVQRGTGAVSRELGEYLAAIGDKSVRDSLNEAMRS